MALDLSYWFAPAPEADEPDLFQEEDYEPADYDYDDEWRDEDDYYAF